MSLVYCFTISLVTGIRAVANTNSKRHSSLSQYCGSTIGSYRPYWKPMQAITPWERCCYRSSWTMTNGTPLPTEVKRSMGRDETMTYMTGSYSPLCMPSNTGSTTCSAYTLSGTPTTATSHTSWRSKTSPVDSTDGRRSYCSTTIRPTTEKEKRCTSPA